MTDYDTGYGEDYATIQLADAARPGLVTDRVVLHVSDQYGSTTYQLRAYTITKPGEYVAAVGGVTILATQTPNPNTTDKLKFTGVRLNKIFWSMYNTFNLHLSRCEIEGDDYFIRSLAGAGTGTVTLENTMFSTEDDSNDKIALNMQNANCTWNLFFVTGVSKGGVGRLDRPIFINAGVLNVANCILFSVWTQTIQVGGGTVNVDHNIMNTNVPAQANGWVKTQQQAGFACHQEGYGAHNDFRVIKSFQEDGVWSYNGIDLTVYNVDIDGRIRDTSSPSGASPGCSNNFDIFDNADFPTQANTLNTDTTNNLPGLWAIADRVIYKKDETFGIDGTSEVGELEVGDKPDPVTDIAVDSITDQTITIAVVTPNPTDMVYIVFQNVTQGTGWTDLDATFSSEGSGTVDVTPLTNGDFYQFSAVINNGSCDSQWAVPVYATPTDGTNTPEGFIAHPKLLLKELLAASPTWIAWAGVDTEHSIRLAALDSISGTEYNTVLRDARPFALIGNGNSMDVPQFAGGSQNFLRPGGGLMLVIEANVPTEYQGDENLSAASIWFDTQVGKVLQEISELSGQTGKLDGHRISLVDGPWRTDEEERKKIGDAFIVAFEILWGMTS